MGFSSKFRGVSPKCRGSGRWQARLYHSGKLMHLGMCDREEDAARAWDRMMLWFHLHGIALIRPEGGGTLTSDSMQAALNFVYEGYAGQVDDLRGIPTQDAMVLKLRQEGWAQPGSRKRKPA